MKMTKRERNLVIAFLGILFLMSVILGVYFFKKHQAELEKEKQMLRLEVQFAKNSVELAQVLEKEKKWLTKYEPRPVEYSVAMSEFQELVTKSAESHELTLSSVKVKMVGDYGGSYRKIEIMAMVKAKQEVIVDWLVKLHNPIDFQVVTTLKISPDAKEEDLLVTQVAIEKWIVEAK